MKTFAILILFSLVTQTADPQIPQAKDSTNNVIAVVLGKNITLADKNKLSRLIFGGLLEQFAKDNAIEVTEQEIVGFIQKSNDLARQRLTKLEKENEKLTMELKDTSLTARERNSRESRLRMNGKMIKSMSEGAEQTDEANGEIRQLAIGFIKNWKINKALYDKYGGRVIFQQLGVEPLDAYRDFLREQEKIGAFKILDKSCETSFWQYYISEKQRFYSKEDGEKFINTPWWLEEQQTEIFNK